MKHLPAALFFVDGIHERISISEAKILGIPTFGIVDSNTDPRDIDFPIPANDDSMKTIRLIADYMADVIIEANGGMSQSDQIEEASNNNEESVQKIEEKKEIVVETVVSELNENLEDSSEKISMEVNEKIKNESEEN